MGLKKSSPPRSCDGRLGWSSASCPRAVRMALPGRMMSWPIRMRRCGQDTLAIVACRLFIHRRQAALGRSLRCALWLLALWGPLGSCPGLLVPARPALQCSMATGGPCPLRAPFLALMGSPSAFESACAHLAR